MASYNDPTKQSSAKYVRWTGYILSFVTGLVLWPQLILLGWRMENVSFGFASLLGWGCLPISMLATTAISFIFEHGAASLDGEINADKIKRGIEKSAMFGIIACLSSCSAIAVGYEPPAALNGFFELDSSNKFR